MVPHLHDSIHLSSSGKRSKVQLLFSLAQQTLAPGKPPSQDALDTLALAISSVPLSELCLDKSEHCQLPEPARPNAIGHHCSSSTDEAAAEQLRGHGRHAPTLREDNVISLGVFCLPALSQIPLHDHPGMTVYTRVLYGQLHYMAYDWANPAFRADYHRQEAAALVTDRTMTSHDEPIVLFPRAGGNLHQLTALTDCAIISLLCPPYNTQQGRDCHYYCTLEARDGDLDGNMVLLEECDPPADFYIGCGKYRGVVPRPRAQPRSPTTTLDCPSVGSPINSVLSAPCNVAAAAATARGREGGQRMEPRLDTIPIPHKWL